MECGNVANRGYKECHVEWIAEEEAEVCETVTDNSRVERSLMQALFLVSKFEMHVMSKQYLHESWLSKLERSLGTALSHWIRPTIADIIANKVQFVSK